jgi:hypothetical protein
MLAHTLQAHAILFYSQHPDGVHDRKSLHGGCPVLKGTKWAANLWIWNRVRLGYPAAPRKAGAAPHDPNMRTSRDRIVHGNSHKQQQNTGGSFDHLSKLLSSNNKEQQAHDQQAQEDTVHDARQRKAVFSNSGVVGAKLLWESSFFSYLAPGAELAVDTFVGHKWNVVVDINGEGDAAEGGAADASAILTLNSGTRARVLQSWAVSEDTDIQHFQLLS